MALEYEGKLYVTLIKGIDIADLDEGGASDPYCVFVLGDEEVKSKSVSNSLNPEWNDKFCMGVVDRRYILRCLLYDQDEGEDDGAEDDFLGYAEISLEDLEEDTDMEFELPLQRASSGKLVLSLKIDMEPNPEEEQDEDLDEDEDDFPMISEAAPKAELGSMAVKAWVGAIVPPDGEDKVRKPPARMPAQHLELEWAHGFRGHDTRQCAQYNKHGDMVWITAAVGVVYNKATRTQRFFTGHENDILCMAMSPDGTTVATGQWTGNKSQGQAYDPKILVWNSEDCSVIAELTGAHQRGISCLGFSPSGNRLASVGMDDQNSVVVWDWKRGKPLGPSSKGGANKVLMLAFDTVDDNKFLTVGAKTSAFWSISPGGKVAKKNAVFGRKLKQQTMLACAPHRGGFLSGAYQGQLYTWTGNSAADTTEGHEGPVYALYADGKHVLSGGKDGKVILRDISLKVLQEFNVGQNVRSVHLHDNHILVGSYEGGIFEIDIKSKNVECIMMGHGGMKERGNEYAGETWGLDTSPDNVHAASVGDDRVVRIFNLPEHTCVGQYNDLPHRARACSWHPDGRRLAVACKDGKIVILEWDPASGQLNVLTEFQKRNFSGLPKFPEQGGMDELRFSPDGRLLATGCHSEGKGGTGGIVDIYGTDNWRQLAACKGHTSFIRHLDWTADSNYLHSTDANPELLFWNAKDGSQLKSGASALKNEKWATFSAEIGWPVQGVIRKLPGFVKEMDMTDINMCDVNPDETLLVSGDDFGNVALYNYPCTNKADEAAFFGGHSSFVQNVKFSKDGRYVMSAGGHDHTIMQWRVIG